jgi:signal transduction histidine kinase
MLAHSFNQMIVSLKKSRGELKQWGEELERKVEERTADLEQRGQELADTNVRLEEASQHKSQFLANMSHELRTPLNSIIGYTKLMLDGLEGDINEEQKQDLQTVYNNSKHLLELINGLLDLSRIEAGKTVLSYGTFTISDLLSEVIPGMEQLAREKGLTLTYSVAPDIDNLYADKAKTRQVLINILGNAVKFTNEGSVKLDVAETDNDFVFSVTDTGIGIKEEDLEAIFESFKQVGPAQIAGYEGTGLGLAISKQFIEMQGGRIWAESELGKGSTFTFTLPKKKVASP